MEKILARNERGQTMEWTKFQWDLLGKNKCGWVQIEHQVVESSLNTGDKKPNEPQAVIGANALEELKAAFIKASAGISKSDLTSYLTKQGIDFEQYPKSKDMVLLLGELNNYNINFFKENF